MLSILISSFLIMLLGLFDDLTKNDRPMPNKFKFAIQLVVSLIIVLYGGLEVSRITMFGHVINFGIFLSRYQC